MLLLATALALAGSGTAVLAQSAGSAPSERAAPAPVAPPESSGRSTEPGDDAPRPPLSDALARSQGVIAPPATGDHQSVMPPPSGHGESMPVIPPPGTPGGNPEVQPK
jgi:hypothetical protein